MLAFHILIVEDNEGIRASLIGLLRRLGFTNVDIAVSGYDALKLLISRQYDLILLDNKMPIMSGLEFLRRCKSGQILDWTTVIMVTAAADNETISIIRDEALKVDEFVVKPLDYKILTAKIDRLLRSDASSPIQRMVQSEQWSNAAQKGSFLSIGTDRNNSSITFKMFGFLLNDDRKLVKDLPEAISNMPEQFIIIDVTNILMIDDFGLGMLLLINGVAAMAGKQLTMIVDDKTVGKRLSSLGIQAIISMDSAKPL